MSQKKSFQLMCKQHRLKDYEMIITSSEACSLWARWMIADDGASLPWPFIASITSLKFRLGKPPATVARVSAVVAILTWNEKRKKWQTLRPYSKNCRERYFARLRRKDPRFQIVMKIPALCCRFAHHRNSWTSELVTAATLYTPPLMA